MGKKPDYQLEYVYNKSQFKKALWWCVGLWLVTRIIRVVMYFTVGIMVFGGIPAAFIFFFSGMIFGVATIWIVIYRRSVRVEDIERERKRLQK